MASIFTPSFSHFSPPPQHTNPSSPKTKYRIKVTNFTTKPHRNPRPVLPSVRRLRIFSFQDDKRCFKNGQELNQEPPASLGRGKKRIFSSGFLLKPETSVIQTISRPIVYALFCIAVGFYPFGLLPARAVGAPVVSEVTLRKREKKLDKESTVKGHEFSEFTRSLLEEVSRLLKCIEEVRKGNGCVEEVRLQLKVVKGKKEGLQKEIMDGLYKELSELRKEKRDLVKCADEIVDGAIKVRREYDIMRGKAGKERIEELDETMRMMEEEYSGIWGRVGEIEDMILRRETMALSVGVRELCFIERECEELVKRFSQEMRQRDTDR